MLIYLIVFLITTYFVYKAEISKKESSKKYYIFLAIFLLAAFAGCRAESVGTDVRNYGMNNFNLALRYHSFAHYYSNYSIAVLSEPLYHLLVFFLSRVFTDYHWALFFYELITVSFCYLGIERCNKIFNTKKWLAFLVYNLVLFNISINLMRQMIAVSIIFYALTFAFEERYKTYIALTFLAVGFHSSGIIGAAILPMYLILRQKRKISTTKQFTQGIIFFLLLFLTIALGSTGVRFLVSKGIVRSLYLSYLDDGTGAVSTVSYSMLVIYLIYFGIYMKHYHQINRKGLESMFFLMCSVIMLISPFGQLISTYISRIANYFIPFQIISLVNISQCYSKKSQKDWIILLVSLFLCVWYFNFVIRGIGETIPYTTFF